MAAPIVSGVAALMKSKYPGMTATVVKKTILDSVDKIPTLNSLCVIRRIASRKNRTIALDQIKKIIYVDTILYFVILEIITWKRHYH